MEFHGNIITYTGFDGTERSGKVVEATANIKGGHPGFVVETPAGERAAGAGETGDGGAAGTAVSAGGGSRSGGGSMGGGTGPGSARRPSHP